MPRLTRSIPSYRKHRSSGQAIVTLGGRAFYLGPYGTKVSRNEYDRLVGEWLQQGRQLADDKSDLDSLCVNQLIVAYLHFAQGYYRKDGRLTSEYTDIAHALRHLKRLYGRKPVSEFGPIALQTVMQRICDSRREELVKAFRKVNPKLPIIVTAPLSRTPDDLQKSCPNASNYLTLPFTTEQLRKTVSEYVPSIAG